MVPRLGSESVGLSPHAPFGDGTLDLHSDHGPMIGWQAGHSDRAELTIVVDYHTARSLVLDSSDEMSVLDRAARTGALRIEGGGSVMRQWLAKPSSGPGAAAVEDPVGPITI